MSLVTPQQFEVAQDASTGRWFVIDHLLNGHVSGLPDLPADDEWELDVNDDGFA